MRVRIMLLMRLLPPANGLFLFFTAAIVLLVIPGPSLFYIITRSVDQGRKAGLASTLGIATGTLGHVMAATAGLSSLLVTSSTAYAFVKYAGAVYLMYMGIKKFCERPTPDDNVSDVEQLPLRRIYVHGVLVQVMNPKTAIFFFAFLPQFVSPARGNVSIQFLVLGMLFSMLAFLSDSIWVLAAGSVARWLRYNQASIPHHHYISGTVYLGLGLATAITGSSHK
jgi:threonine/homoserine/homoserine lactone efflux protein